MFFFKQKIKALRSTVQPSQDFRTRLWSELSQGYDREFGCPSPHSRVFRFATVGLTSLVLVFAMGTGVYAYESPEVVNGHPLYFVKSGIESVQERAARSPEARAQFHARMMERRLQEGERHLSQHPEQVQPSLNAAADEFEMTVEALDGISQDEISRNHIIESLSIHNARYLELSARVEEHGERTEEFVPLRMRIEGHQLSEDEQIRLFELKQRARDRSDGR